MKKLYDLTFPQESIMLTEQFYKNTSVNNICGSAIVKDAINFDMFEKAVNQVIRDNDSLRIRFVQDKGKLKQYVADYEKRNIEIIDINEESEIQEIEKSLIKKSFSIIESNLFEVKFFRFLDNSGGFVLNIHHSISDGWGLGLVCRKIMKAYSNLINNIEEKDTELSYINYAENQDEYVKSEKFKKDKEYWDNLFKIVPTSAVLPCDISEVNSDLSSLGERLEFSIPKNKMKLMQDFCVKNKVSMFNFLIAIYSIYISKIINLNNFTIGTPILNRTNYKEKNTPGMFINVVPMYIQTDANQSFVSFVNSISQNTVSLLRHQKYPYKLILEELRKKDASIPNLYNIVFSYQLTKTNNETDLNYTTRWTFNGCAGDDLTIQFFDLDENGTLNIAYDFKKLKYSNNYIKDMNNRIMEMIDQILQNPEILFKDVEIITKSEKDTIINKFNDTYVKYNKNENVIKSFEKQVKKNPEKIAIVCNDEKITYKELEEKSNSLANYLKSVGAKYKDIIGIMMNRSIEMSIGILAILKVGGTYLPIDPSYPKDRIEYMLEDSNSKLLLTNSKNYNLVKYDIKKIDIGLESDIYNFSNKEIELNVSPEDLIYLIYTSGSTGKPKGVMLKHKNIINFLLGTKNAIDFDSSKVMLSVTTICFDIFVLEFWGALTSGMTLILANEIEQNNTDKLNKLCLKYNANMIQTTPSRFIGLIQDEENIEFIKNMTDIMVGGEGLPQNLLDKLFTITKANIFNMYGPTETAVWSTIKKISPKDDIITIGKPIANTKCYILDKDKKMLPLYIPGELYIGGEGVSRGYLNREELTNEKFVISPYDKNELIYNTGDLAYFDKNGEIIHLGRTDFQVKIRGYRMELGEIESKIIEIPAISNAVVIADKENKYLICYYISKEEIDSNEITAQLLKDLPNYMIPSVFHKMDKFPLTPNGKLDRKKLPKVELEKSDVTLGKTKTEKLLSKIISQVLKIDEVDIESPFMTIGLDSLGIIEVQTKLLQYNYVLNTQDFYQYNTIKSLAENIDNNIYTYKEHDAQVPIQFRHKFDEFISKSEHKTFKDNILGNVFLTGANGFIGIHILHELLNTTNVKVYCLVRKKSNLSSKQRLINQYKFYFDKDITDLIDDRIIVLNGTIIEENIGLPKTKIQDLIENVTTIIHTAARVKHYGDYNEFYNINTQGTKNIAEFAFENKKRFIHISSISVSGNYLVKQDNRDVEFSENNLYIGQKYADNVYVHSKFEAEKIVLELMERGLTAQIHRLGILSGRLTDGVFQENIEDNAFYSRIKSLVNLSVVTEEMLEQQIEFTPVDVCVKSIVLLAKNDIANNRIFHLYNNNFIKIREVINILNLYGTNIETVSEKAFNERIVELSKGDESNSLLGIINDLDSSENSMVSINYNYSVNVKCDFTQKYLHLLKNDWNDTNIAYIKKLVAYMKKVKFI